MWSSLWNLYFKKYILLFNFINVRGIIAFWTLFTPKSWTLDLVFGVSLHRASPVLFWLVLRRTRNFLSLAGLGERKKGEELNIGKNAATQSIPTPSLFPSFCVWNHCCLLNDPAYEWQRGCRWSCRWPCIYINTDLTVFIMQIVLLWC